MRTGKRIASAISVIMTIGFLVACPSLLNAVSGGIGSQTETTGNAKDGQGSRNMGKVISAINPFVEESREFSFDTQIPQGYKKIAENENLTLYLNANNLGLKIKDNRTGYVWSSVIDRVEETENNRSWANFIGSGISIEYFERQMPASNRTELLSEKNKTIRIKEIPNGFVADIVFNALEIGLQLKVTIEGDQLVVAVPNQSITEGEHYKLASVYLYPFLGATRKAEVPGYMFIPDGSGALIRFNDNQNKFKLPYEGKIYGANDGIETEQREPWINPAYKINFPVFGLVHGENKYGVFAVVEQGKYNAKILAYPNGVNTQYNWVTAQYIFRESYLQPTSRTLGGVVIYEKDKNTEDIATRYFFLNGAEANYVGMAKTYQKYLADRGVLRKKTAPKDGDIPFRVDFLGAESKNGLFSKQIVPMTTVNQMQSIMDDLNRNRIRNLMVVLKGWNRGGLSGTSPAEVEFEKKLGNDQEFRQFADRLKQEHIPLYFYDDYTVAYDESGRFSARADAAKKIDKSVLEIEQKKEVYPNYYYMSADKSAKIAKENINEYTKAGIDAVAVDHTGHILFSELKDGGVKHRADTAATYAHMMENLRKSGKAVVMYSPNDYMLPYTDAYLDVPMYSSQYNYISDTVPFVQIVLKGYMDYFAPYANFFANQTDELLRMVEYGAYPSFYLTHESSYKLKHTNSDDLFTSAYGDRKSDILNYYRFINDALRKVGNATIVNRTILERNVVKVSYSNGTEIIVNYNPADAVYNGKVIPGKAFTVTEVNR